MTLRSLPVCLRCVLPSRLHSFVATSGTRSSEHSVEPPLVIDALSHQVSWFTSGPRVNKGRYRRDTGRWRGPGVIILPEGHERYFVSWRGRCLLLSAANLKGAGYASLKYISRSSSLPLLSALHRSRTLLGVVISCCLHQR